MVQFLMKHLLKQRISAVHHDFHLLLVATKMLTVKLHSVYVKLRQLRSRKFWKGWTFLSDSGSPIELFFTSHSRVWNSCWNDTISFETFVETENSCCVPQFQLIASCCKIVDSQTFIHVILKSRSWKFWKGRIWSLTFTSDSATLLTIVSNLLQIYT